MTSVVFFDVEDQDRPHVLSVLPNAEFVPANLKEDDLIKKCKDAEIISTFITTRFPKNVIDSLPSLKLLCTRSVGYDHIDVDACRKRGVTVCNVPDYGSHVIAEHVFALLLSTLRNVHLASERVKEGNFDYHGLRGIALREKTIGIVGTGKIGRKVARIAHGFGMRILATDQCRTHDIERDYGVRYTHIDELLAASDIITLHIPATEETTHMLNAAAFRTMKQGVVLVNTARGALIDSRALLDALNAGKVSHALLDVLEHENNFEENRSLISHPNVIATPHIAFYADDSMKNMHADSIDSIRQWLAGEKPTHTVEPHAVTCDLPAIMK